MLRKLIIIWILFYSFQLYGLDKVFMQTAKIAGTGGAVTASAFDLSTFIVNPAGISQLNSVQFIGDFFNLYQAGFENTFIGLYYPFFNQGGIGAVWQRINYENALEFEYKDDIYYVVFSKEILGICCGINGKYFREYLNSDVVKLNKSEIDIDFGIIKKFISFGIGFSILNINTFLKDDKDRDSVMNAGIFIKPIQEIELLFDYRNINKENEMSVGAEYSPFEEIVFRSGWYVDFYYSFGLSYYIRRFRIDYTCAVSQYTIGTTHYFSVNYFL